jgi:transaldolase/glucose-6-phosphate isomerase
VANEPSIPSHDYGKDRLFVSFVLEKDPARGLESRTKALEKAGHPVIRLILKDKYALGEELFRWEIAIAAAGSILGIHPFNQPDVDLAKDLARQAMAKRNANGKRAIGVKDVVSSGEVKALRQAFEIWISSVRPGDYIALQAYLPPNSEVMHALQKLRLSLLKRTGRATTLGYGPRFLHSTGQLHKGGPDEVLVLQLVDEPILDLDVPETDYTFNTLIQAQSLGDFEALKQRGRRVLRINLKKDIPGGLDLLT